MAELRKVEAELRRLSSELDSVSSQLSTDPTNQYEEMARYFTLLEQLDSIAVQLEPDSALAMQVMRLAGRTFTQGDVAEQFAVLRVRLDDTRVVLDATHAVWEAERTGERKPDPPAAETQKKQKKPTSAPAAEEDEDDEDLVDDDSAARRARKRKEKKKRQKERQRAQAEAEADEEEDLAIPQATPQSVEESVVGEGQEDDEEDADIPEGPPPPEPELHELPSNAGRRFTSTRFSLHTLPGHLYTKSYTCKPIPNSPKVELAPFETANGAHPREWLVTYRAVVQSRPREQHVAPEFVYSDPAIADGEQTKLATLAGFLAKEWERKQTQEQTDLLELPSSLEIEWLRRPSSANWTLLLSHGGYFAGVCFIDGKPALHKTFHRYIVRKKQGGRQSTHDKSGGSMTSVGSQLRRHHEQKYKEQIQQTLRDWAPQVRASTAVFTHAPGPLNFGVFFFDDTILSKGDPRIHTIPFALGRPSFEEAKRAYDVLRTINHCVSTDEST